MAGKYWTEQINPVSGCTPVSEACANCYARDLHNRFHGEGFHGVYPAPAFYAKSFGEVTLRPEQLKRFDQLRRMQKPQVVFVGNMTDLFHEKVDMKYIGRVFNAIAPLRQHIFLILTKRTKRMRDILTAYEATCCTDAGFVGDFPHVWIGTTVENQQRADERIPYLLETPAAHRWISAEPLLGPVELLKYNGTIEDLNRCCCEGPKKECKACPYDGPGFDLVIAGGESGRKARPMAYNWPKNLKDQCDKAGVRFHFKQWSDQQAFGEAQTFEGVDYSQYKPADIWKVSA